MVWLISAHLSFVSLYELNWVSCLWLLPLPTVKSVMQTAHQHQRGRKQEGSGGLSHSVSLRNLIQFSSCG